MPRSTEVEESGFRVMEAHHSRLSMPAYPYDWAEDESGDWIEPILETSAPSPVEAPVDEGPVTPTAESDKAPPASNGDHSVQLVSHPELGRRHPRWSRLEAGLLAGAAFLLGGLSVALFDRVASHATTDTAVRDLGEMLNQVRATQAEQMNEFRTLILSKPPTVTTPTEVKLAEGELAPIRESASQLKKTLADMSQPLYKSASLNEKLDGLTDRVNMVAAEVKKVPDLIARYEAKRPVPSGPPPQSSETSTRPAIAVALYERGVSLYGQSNVTDAEAVFHACRVIDPADARSWYYEALSHGYVSGDWAGQAAKLALAGVERERADPGQIGRINAEFASLAPNAGGDWLAYYRRQAASR